MNLSISYHWGGDSLFGAYLKFPVSALLSLSLAAKKWECLSSFKIFFNTNENVPSSNKLDKRYPREEKLWVVWMDWTDFQNRAVSCEVFVPDVYHCGWHVMSYLFSQQPRRALTVCGQLCRVRTNGGYTVPLNGKVGNRWGRRQVC